MLIDEDVPADPSTGASDDGSHSRSHTAILDDLLVRETWIFKTDDSYKWRLVGGNKPTLIHTIVVQPV